MTFSQKLDLKTLICGGSDMKTEELKQLQDILFEEKTKLLSKSQEFRSQHLQANAQAMDEAEASANDINMNLAIELQERDRLSLMRIDRALDKMKTGSFGDCESCGGEIGLRRLMIQPLARLCVDCMMEQETEAKWVN